MDQLHGSGITDRDPGPGLTDGDPGPCLTGLSIPRAGSHRPRSWSGYHRPRHKAWPQGWGKTPYLQANRKLLPRRVGCKKMMIRVLHESVKMLKECYNTRICKFRQMHFLGRLAPPYLTYFSPDSAVPFYPNHCSKAKSQQSSWCPPPRKKTAGSTSLHGEIGKQR